MKRRALLLSALGSALAPAAAGAAGLPDVMVYRDPGCGCCEAWVAILREAGFTASIADDAKRADRLAGIGIARRFASCHTALIGAYAVEGHVPVRDILRLLAEQPQGVIGLSVPGMPVGSPGMGPPDGGDRYDVLLLARDGGSSVYASY
jgi:hypothetical protein